ncbi:MAG: biotin--[acetyl-CoA-carboxylase] ligase [Rhizobiaceae bacterium]
MKQSIDGLPDWRHLALDETDSTNSDALRQFADGDPGHLWITADRQTSGRGRRGRTWESPTGNLHASLLLVDPAPLQQLATLPLLAAVALHDALIELVPHLADNIAIKWPNDLLHDGAKISGILLETANNSSGELGLALGFGVNCGLSPSVALYPANALSQDADTVSPKSAFSTLAQSIARWLDIWDRGAGFGVVREQWLLRATGIGGPITARFPDHEISGTFRDLDADGLMLLELRDGTIERISAADIFLGNSNPQRA